jgi:hypothetical protein
MCMFFFQNFSGGPSFYSGMGFGVFAILILDVMGDRILKGLFEVFVLSTAH